MPGLCSILSPALCSSPVRRVWLHVLLGCPLALQSPLCVSAAQGNATQAVGSVSLLMLVLGKYLA